MSLVDNLVQGNAIRKGYDFLDSKLKIDSALGWAFRKIYYSKKRKIKKNRIFVMTYDRDFSCNPRYIIEELLEQKKDVEIYAVYIGNPALARKSFPREVKLVKFKTKEMFDAMATSKIWIDNALNCVWFGMKKHKGQYYLNTWHGSLGIKKLGGDRKWMNRASKCDKVTDFCITNSTFEENVFKETFWPNVPYLKYGHARNDVFFDKEKLQEKRKAVQDYFHIEGDKIIALYAPTFREDDSKYVPVDFEALKKSIEKKYNKECVIIVRAHNKDRSNSDIVETDWLKQGSFFGDMQELLPGIDIGISDYSSWVYDFMLSGRPIILYVPDIELYDQKRGFYYPIETTPFPIAKNNQELGKCIESFNENKYKSRMEAFLDDKGCYEDGQACKRIVKAIDDIINDKFDKLHDYEA